MTNPRIDGAAETLTGKAQSAIGRLTGDSRLQLDGRLNEVKGKARDAYGRVIDGLLVMRKIENVPVGANNKPKISVMISECGQM